MGNMVPKSGSAGLDNTGRSPLRSKSAPELALLVITVTICGMLLMSGIGVILVELIVPETSTERLVGSLGLLVVLLGGLGVGYVIGRSTAHAEALAERVVAQAQMDAARRIVSSAIGMDDPVEMPADLGNVGGGATGSARAADWKAAQEGP